MATLIHNNPPESHLTSQPNMAEVPSNYLSQRVLSLCTISVLYCKHGQFYVYANLHNSPSYLCILPDKYCVPFLAACLCTVRNAIL